MTASESRPRFRINREPPPLFNKRLFKAQAAIVITEKILRILRRPVTEMRTAEELHAVKAVVSALKDIHRGLQYIKEALCKVVTYEKIESGVEIRQKAGEGSCLSCFYILSGSVEAKYKITNEQSRAENRLRDDCDIKHTHVAGEFLGLVSGDGPSYDYPPPDSIRTAEVSEFLIIDRELFHQTVKCVQNQYVREIEAFVNHESFLSKLPSEERNKLVALMAKQEYPAGKVIVKQGDSTEHLFFVARGRCQYYRSVHISEIGREELVKLGQAEKGDFFGESVVIDGSQCFCSVASIGPVTCYLVNNWIIKTNEQILKLLHEQRRNFLQDSDIKHYIRDNDVWQSFKRDAVVELLNGAKKRDIIINWQNIPDTLSRAVNYGNAKRRFSQPVRQDEMPGAPKPVDALFAEVPRWRRRSSAILTSNAAAVVKAVLLLRQKSDGTASDGNMLQGVELRFPTLSFGQNERASIKSNSAPAGSRSDRKLRSNNPITEFRSQSVAGKRDTKVYRSISPPCANRLRDARKGGQASQLRSKSCSPGFGNASKSGVNNNKLRSPQKDNRQSHSSEGAKITKKLPVGLERFPAVVKTIPSEKSASFTQCPIDPEAANGKGFVSTANFVVKEIINTGIPGRKASPKPYRRFPPSMFEMLDEPREEKSEQKDLNPWSVSMAAGKWLRTLKKQRKTVKDHEQHESSASPTPIIVIQEWSPGLEEKHERADSPQLQVSIPSHRRGSRKMSRTPSPALNNVTEESEDDMKIYEEAVETESVEERWYTEIHEARDTSYQQLAMMNQDMEEMKRRRNRSRKTVELNEPLHQVYEELDKATTKQQDNIEKINTKSFIQKSKSAKLVNEEARLDANITSRKNRSRTFSGAIDTSQKSYDNHSRTRQDRGQFDRAQSLSRVNHSAASRDLDSAKRNEKVEERSKAERAKNLFIDTTTRKSTTKVDKRRQLLLSRVFGGVTRHPF